MKLERFPFRSDHPRHVMAGTSPLVPAIDVDPRVKPGGDEKWGSDSDLTDRALAGLVLLIAAALSTPAMAQTRAVPRQVPQEVVTGRPGIETTPPPIAGQWSPTQQQQAVIGDVAGGRVIPDPILKILADPHIDPNVAYILWQLSRKPMDEWTLSELGFVGQIAPTLVEAALPIDKVQMLYQFWGLDTSDVFNPSLGPSWQSQSTAFNPYSAANVAAISSADCQVDISQMSVATYRACIGGGQ